MTIPVITIDGPSGSGKGTLSHLLARELQWHLLDSGAIYRLCALECLNKGVNLDKPEEILAVTQCLDIRFVPAVAGTDIFLGELPVNQEIREERVGMAASKIAAYMDVREALLACQQAFSQAPGLIADGRDMGTVVFPSAPLKFFLTASAEKRAERRFRQLTEQNIPCDYREILAAIEQRDHQDQSRKTAPLIPARDAIVVNSSDMTIEQVFTYLLNEARKTFDLPYPD